MKSLDKVVFKKNVAISDFSFLNIYMCAYVYIIQLLKKKKNLSLIHSPWDELCRPMKDSECWYIWVKSAIPQSSTIIERTINLTGYKSLAALTIPLNFKG